MGNRILYVVRHGQTKRTTHTRDPLGSGLTDLGREQAELTARRLSALPIDIIHHSLLRRAAETAKVIASAYPDVPVRSARLLQECIPYLPTAFVEWYTTSSEEEIQEQGQTLPPALKPWLDLWPTGVQWQQIEQGMHQAQRAFEKYFVPTHRPDRHEVIVCHGNILRYFVCRALNVSAETWIQTDVYNCGISEILVEPNGRVMLVSHNDTGHLPYTLRTYI